MVEKNYRLQDIQLSKNPPPQPFSRIGATSRFHDLSIRLPHPKPEGLEDEVKTGGEYRARTGDLLVANQALSQLS